MKEKLNEAIHEELGWKKVPWPDDGRDVIGCKDGWAWESPDGHQHKEGHAGMVPDYMYALREVARILPAVLSVVERFDDQIRREGIGHVTARTFHATAYPDDTRHESGV